MSANVGLRRRALVVEDDEDIRSSVDECLQSADFDTAGATNGEAALAWLRAHEAPSLIVLDLMMPVMDGFDFRKAQLRDARLSKIPVLLLTADAHGGRQRRFQVQGSRAHPRREEAVRAGGPRARRA